TRGDASPDTSATERGGRRQVWRAVPKVPSGELSGEGRLCDTLGSMSPLKVGYARVSTDEQDLTAQRDGLAAFGVEPKRIYVDHGLTGRNPDREGRRQARAARRGREQCGGARAA